MKTEEKNNRVFLSTGRKWEAVFGYSRAVKAGNNIAVTGTLGMNEDGSFPETAGGQTELALATIKATLEALGANVQDIIRTRIYVRDISQWEKIGKVHAKMLEGTRPATTMVQVSELAVPEALVEVEADAWVS